MRFSNNIQKSNDVIIQYINLGGVGFSINSENIPGKGKTYSLAVKAELPDKSIGVILQIAIIGVDKRDNGYYYCRAVPRNLNDAQLAAIKEISSAFAFNRITQPETLWAALKG